MHPSPVHSPDAFGAPACPRRHASISYNPPPRDRGNKQRPLVVVIPPSILLHQYGLLGHTLSIGPSQRLAHGIVMPLYPTMYAQLTAISREYNFPSTAGLCLYLHHSDNAFTVTPRISDEAWHSLWCPAFDSSSPARVLPIFGTIEFDVDLRYARWYPSWLSSSQRDIPDSASDYWHRRVDSHTTIYDGRADDRRETYMHHPLSSGSSQRHFPKKLSLLENTTNTKTSLQLSSLSPEKPFSLAQVPSPDQECEPGAVRQDLRTRVQSWRASATQEPSPIATVGQPSLEPTNALKIQVSSNNTLMLEEYSWSITSAGPDDRESVISVDSERLPSIYIEDRLVGSVCSTPSVCTSFGPFDYGFDSLTRGTHILPSLDLVQRAGNSLPMASTTATTWRSENDDCRYPYFTIYSALYPFFDLYPATAGENTSTLPLAKDRSSASHVTSMTQSQYPYLHISAAGESLLTLSSRIDQSIGHAISIVQNSSYPCLDIYPAVYPFFDLYPAVAGGSLFNSSYVDQPTINHVIQGIHYPYLQIYSTVYPFFNLYPAVAGGSSFTPCMDLPTIDHATSKQHGFHYPYLQIYPAIYPSFDLYPAVAVASLYISSCMERSTINRATSKIQSSRYPYLQIYPTIYPFFNLYPVVAVASSYISSCMDRSTISHATPKIQGSQYPYLQIYPTIYPFFNLYPAIDLASSYIPLCTVQSTIDRATSKIQSSQYPYLEIYPAIYPIFDLYPAVAAEGSYISSCMDQGTIGHATSKRQDSQYPYLRIYPAAYPFLDLYPTIAAESSSAYTSSLNQNTVSHTVSLIQACHYPHLSIYCPVYPFFDLYPPRTTESSSASTSLADGGRLDCVVPFTQKRHYPYLNIYPAVYPFFDLYPALTKGSSPVSVLPIDQTFVDHATPNCHYPYLNIYPSVYPFFDIYPNLTGEYLSAFHAVIDTTSANRTVSITAQGYPSFNLYPSCYPFLDIYPSTLQTAELSPRFEQTGVSASLGATSYPNFNSFFGLYPAVYPHFDLYPTIAQSNPSRMDVISRYYDPPISNYPAFVIYRPVYPHFHLYPSITAEVLQIAKPIIAHLKPTYPFIDIYPPVYPHFRLYPIVDLPNLHPESTQNPPVESYTLSPARPELQERLSKKFGHKKSHKDLHFTVFPNGFVPTPSGTVMESYVVPGTSDFTSLFKAALQVQVIDL